jgi:predicted HTH domain antitoxin
MPVVNLELKEDIATFVKTRAAKEEVEELVILEDLLERGFEQRLRELYKQYQEGEISLGYLAEQLGVGTWRAYHLLEERGLRTANI